MLHHAGKDFEDLRLAISQLRAERQAQLQQQQLQLQQLQQQQQQQQWFVRTGSHHTTLLLDQDGPAESVQLTSGKKAVAATLELIHSALQLELGEEEAREVGAEGRRSGGRSGRGAEPGEQRDGTSVRVVGSLGGNLGSSNSNTSTPSSNQNTAAVTGPSNQTESTNGGREKADQQGEPAFPKAAEQGAASSSIAACPVEGDRARLVN